VSRKTNIDNLMRDDPRASTDDRFSRIGRTIEQLWYKVLRLEEDNATYRDLLAQNGKSLSSEEIVNLITKRTNDNEEQSMSRRVV